MGTERKETYWIRIKMVEANLLGFGISAGSARSLTHCYPVGLLEKLIRATEKRQPAKPSSYFLNGLRRSRMKHRPQPTLVEDIDI